MMVTKVKCVDARGARNLTTGKEYFAEQPRDGLVTIYNDIQRLVVYPMERFAIMDTNAKIHNLLYEALEAIDAPLDLLQIVGSLDDTQSREETIKQLQAFIEREKAR